MNGARQTQAGRSGRHPLSRPAACCSRLAGISRVVGVGSSSADRHHQAIHRNEQRRTAGVHVEAKRTRLEQQRHADSRSSGARSLRSAIPDADRDAAESSRMVCSDLGKPRLEARNGRFSNDLSARRLSRPEAAVKITVLTPSHGGYRPPIAPSAGVRKVLSTPSHGAMRTIFGTLLTPSDGDLSRYCHLYRRNEALITGAAR